MHPMQSIAVRAARAAGNVIMRNYDQRDQLKVDSKGLRDFVTDVDRHAERMVTDTILKTYPRHGILGEEGDAIEGDGIHQWVIDPLDGTTNYLMGFPHFSVSIALKVRGRVELGLVYDPFKEELFIASKGNGATLNDKRIRVRPTKHMSGAITATGFPFRHEQLREKHARLFAAVIEKTGDARRTGSAALDLAYVAAGRIDAYWEFGLNEWDIAAGSLLVQEAGGLVGDFQGGHSHLSTGDIVAAPPKLFADFLKTVRPYLKPAA